MAPSPSRRRDIWIRAAAYHRSCGGGSSDFNRQPHAELMRQFSAHLSRRSYKLQARSMSFILYNIGILHRLRTSVNPPHFKKNRVDPASCPAGPPTDPDVQISRIRLFEAQFRYATQMAWTIRGRSSG
jgi:hypothetical protein